MKHYFLLEVDSSAPEHQHERLRERVASEMHLHFGEAARCFRVDEGSACTRMLTELRNIIERRK